MTWRNKIVLNSVFWGTLDSDILKHYVFRFDCFVIQSRVIEILGHSKGRKKCAELIWFLILTPPTAILQEKKLQHTYSFLFALEIKIICVFVFLWRNIPSFTSNFQGQQIGSINRIRCKLCQCCEIYWHFSILYAIRIWQERERVS